jgi:predicted GNAT family acetyltransferase
MVEKRKIQFEYPDQAGYPDGFGFLDEGSRAVISELGAMAALEASLTSAARAGSDYELDLSDDAEYGKYVAYLNQDEIGALSYRHVGGRVVLLSLFVDDAFRGHGVATELIEYVLESVRRSGRRITIICPVVRTFIDRNPEYEALVDQAHPGVASESVVQALDAPEGQPIAGFAGALRDAMEVEDPA